jgi:hypothetical protein
MHYQGPYFDACKMIPCYNYQVNPNPELGRQIFVLYVRSKQSHQGPVVVQRRVDHHRNQILHLLKRMEVVRWNGDISIPKHHVKRMIKWRNVKMHMNMTEFIYHSYREDFGITLERWPCKC